MTSADWGILIPAIVGVLGALATWLRGESTRRLASSHIVNEARHIQPGQIKLMERPAPDEEPKV